MSLLSDVLIQVRAGVSVDRIPAVLDADPDLVTAALDHWERVGVVAGASKVLNTGCGSACGTVVGKDSQAPLPATLACAGCVFNRGR